MQRGDALLLHRALQDPALSLPHLQRDNLQLCLEQLRAQRQQKALVGARSSRAHAGGVQGGGGGVPMLSASIGAGLCGAAG